MAANAELSRTFYAAVEHSKVSKPAKPLTNDKRLKFYALFKQATEGPCKKSGPSRFKVTARMKWDAWRKLKTLSKKAAMERYIAYLMKVDPKFRKAMGKSKL